MERANAFGGGFADPVFQAQATFRAVMGAMAEPGTMRTVETDRIAPPSPLSPVAAAVVCTLCDADTPVWFDPVLNDGEAIGRWIAFQTGAPVVTNPIEAHFAVVCNPQAMPALESFALGSQDYPDRSTTVILQVNDLGSGSLLTLRGPGIRECASMAPSPMPRNFEAQWAANNGHFPRGVDLVLAGPDTVAALPRTVRVSCQGD